MTDRPVSDDLEVLAAGLALGLLDDEERAEAMRRQLSDPHFAERVRAWQHKTDGWLESIAPVEAPIGTLTAIESRLDGVGSGRTVYAANDATWSHKVWRSWAITATAASLVLAVALGLAVVRSGSWANAPAQVGSDRPRPAANVAQIKDEAGAPLLSALYDPASGTLSLRLADLQEPERGPELWIIPEDGVPRSLGLLDGQRLTVELSPELRAFLRDGATMAVTIEPREGAPHDAPTGSILGTAVLQEVPAKII